MQYLEIMYIKLYNMCETIKRLSDSRKSFWSEKLIFWAQELSGPRQALTVPDSDTRGAESHVLVPVDLPLDPESDALVSAVAKA